MFCGSPIQPTPRSPWPWLAPGWTAMPPEAAPPHMLFSLQKCPGPSSLTHSWLVPCLSPLLAWGPHEGRNPLQCPKPSGWHRAGSSGSMRSLGVIRQSARLLSRATTLSSQTQMSHSVPLPLPQLLLCQNQASQFPVRKPGKRERRRPCSLNHFFPSQVTARSSLCKMKCGPGHTANWCSRPREKRTVPSELRTQGFSHTYLVGGTLRTKGMAKEYLFSSFKVFNLELSVVWLWNCCMYLVGERRCWCFLNQNLLLTAKGKRGLQVFYVYINSSKWM